MIDIRRAGDRYVTEQPGITTWHCFSSGAHYDPHNVSFGPLVALDEHHVAPGAGFDRHRHRGVELVSWVLAGELRHTDGAGRVHVVRPDTLQYQHTGDGIEHSEMNASSLRPLRFLQLWLVAAEAGPPRYELVHVRRQGCALRVAGEASLRVIRLAGERTLAAAPLTHLFVARGSVRVGGFDVLAAGDAVRARGQVLPLHGTAELFVLTAPES